MKKTIIQANGYDIEVNYGGSEGDFISLTDIAKYKTMEKPGYVIQNWMRNRNTVRLARNHVMLPLKMTLRKRQSFTL